MWYFHCHYCCCDSPHCSPSYCNVIVVVVTGHTHIQWHKVMACMCCSCVWHRRVVVGVLVAILGRVVVVVVHVAILGHYGTFANGHHNCDHNHIGSHSHSQVDGGVWHEPVLHLLVLKGSVMAGLCYFLEPWGVVVVVVECLAVDFQVAVVALLVVLMVRMLEHLVVEALLHQGAVQHLQVFVLLVEQVALSVRCENIWWQFSLSS